MDNEKIEKIGEMINELNWFDDKIPEIMAGFFNNPIEVIDLPRCSEEHLEHLWELLGGE